MVPSQSSVGRQRQMRTSDVTANAQESADKPCGKNEVRAAQSYPWESPDRNTRSLYEAGGRRAPQGKAIRDSFSTDQNSKTRIAGQSKGGDWTLHRPHISRPKVRRPSLAAHAQKRLCCCSTQMPFWYNSSWLRCVHTRGKILRYTEYGL
nr:uncharacterized protein LOC110131763 isoform X1 [Odocoileus virginianus texanus]